MAIVGTFKLVTLPDGKSYQIGALGNGGFYATLPTLTSNATLALVSNIPTKVSELTNDSGYLTASALTNYVTTNTTQTISGAKTFTSSLYLGDTANYLTSDGIYASDHDGGYNHFWFFDGDTDSMGVDNSFSIGGDLYLDGSLRYSTSSATAAQIISIANNGVTTNTTQTISGTKTFTSSVYLGNGSYYYLNTDGIHVTDGDGGYNHLYFSSGDIDGFVISSSLKVDYDLRLDGNLTDGENSITVAQIVDKQDKLSSQTAYSAKGSSTKVPQITTNALGQVTNISEVNISFPTELPASDVYSWAKQSSKPTYNLDEVSDGSTRKLANYLPLSGGTLTGGVLPSTNRTLDFGGPSNRWHYGYFARLLAVESICSGLTYDSNKIDLPSKSGTMALISDIPSSLPASDVYAWAKASTKPSYNLDEVSDGSTRKLASFSYSSGVLTISI